ncbi:DUF7286 family protein [Halomarina litorea]|uniref:DUF7286 family protein n=1 Tax=Halomarina litorea TaxID=2961595 RepID=UPI0020C505EF|nr:hypothetical protein [Halomarina sp. BCD28]
MRFAEDRRGRVPFALVGVLLLVGSATVATTALAPRHDSPAVDDAVREAATSTNPALRRAVADAARAAASDPVLQAAATPWGDALANVPDSTFRAALRLRIYLLARERLAAIEAREGAVVASARLPPVADPGDVVEAVSRVRVASAGPKETALRVAVEGVRVVATREGRTIGTRTVSPTVTVPSPVLALHNRSEDFEERLDAGPLSRGLGQRLTVRLYAVAWARGHAQYRGAPVDNVLANRHIEVAANGAALGVQRATLGASDPAGHDAHGWAAARTMTTDLLVGVGGDPRWAAAVYDAADAGAFDDAGPSADAETAPGTDSPALPDPANESVAVAVNRSADRALTALAANGTVDAVAGRNYAVDARVLAATRTLDRTVEADGSPGGDWRLAGRTVTHERSIRRSTDAPRVTVPDGWSPFARYGRDVVETERTVRRWRRGNRTRTTTRTVTRRVAVGLAVVGRHAPEARLDRRGTTPLYERGGPLDGPNLADAPREAVDRLVDRRGGPDALARRAASGRLDTGTVGIDGERPADLDRWLARDLAALHREVRNVSVSLPRRDVGTYAVDPAARLAAELRDRRGTLLDAPARYDGVADRACVALRSAYLDRVLRNLESRSDDRADRRAALNEALSEEGYSLSDLRDRMAVGTEASPDADVPATAGLGGPLHLSVDTAPSYLTLAPVSGERIAARGSEEVTPLGARNTNLFTVPYGDAADEVTRLLFGEDRVSLALAARTLRASEGAARDNASVREHRAALRADVVAATDRVRERLRETLERAGVGDTASDRRGIVAAGLAGWDTPSGRALALANGSAVPAIVRAAGVSGVDRTRLGAELRTALDDALVDTGTVGESAVAGTSGAARDVASAVTREALTRAGEWAVERGTAEALNRTVERGFAGLPVTPVPGYWYATLNVWTVEVSGGYERVTLRSRRGGRDTVYTRDGTTVTLDVDGDGRAERLGRSTEVTFRTETAIVVVVPPGGLGVGDTDGNADERSSGYD